MRVFIYAPGQAKEIWELAGIDWRDDMRQYLPLSHEGGG
jgi:hypothetical protein